MAACTAVAMRLDGTKSDPAMLLPMVALQAADEAQAAFLHSACQSLRDKMRVVEVGAAPPGRPAVLLLPGD